MKELEKNNPLDDLNSQLQKTLSSSGSGIHFSPFIPHFQSKNKEEAFHNQSVKENEEILNRIKNFNLKPREIRDYLNRFVIKQDEAKKVLSVAICDHYNHIRHCLAKPESANSEYNKQNIILLGPTGVGKTYLMRTIAKLIGVPFVKADATKFSETGYVGGDVEDLVRDLVKVANGDVDLLNTVSSI